MTPPIIINENGSEWPWYQCHSTSTLCPMLSSMRSSISGPGQTDATVVVRETLLSMSPSHLSICKSTTSNSSTTSSTRNTSTTSTSSTTIVLQVLQVLLLVGELHGRPCAPLAPSLSPARGRSCQRAGARQQCTAGSQRSGMTCRWADKEDLYDNMFVVKLMQ